MQQQGPVFQALSLSKNYGGTPALSIHLSLPRGKIIGLLGPNGSGKTTLLKLTAGILTPSTGEVRVCGFPVGPDSKARVSYLPERNSLPTWMTPVDALGFFSDMFPDFDRTRALHMLDRLEIPARKSMQQLSKGTREKVQLILVMSRDAELYLLDEPIGGVDPATRDYVLDTIISGHRPDSTVLISTHLIADVEPILEEFLFIQRGKILRYGSVADVHEKENTTLDALFREVFRC